MLDRQIEHTGSTTALARRRHRKIILARTIDHHVNHRTLDQQLPQCNFSSQRRQNLNANRKLVRMQQWLLAGTLRAMHCDVIEMCRQRGYVEVKAADLSLAPRGSG